jgi:hypothetical protein
MSKPPKTAEQWERQRAQQRERERERRERARRGEDPKRICWVCKTAPVSGIGLRCKPCYLKQERELVEAHAPTKKTTRTTAEALAHDAEVVRARSVVRREQEPHRYMMVAPGEYWLKDPKCRGCGKHIMYTGTCYRCGTGREREVLRREERTEV